MAYSMWTVRATSHGSNSIRRSVSLWLNVHSFMVFFLFPSLCLLFFMLLQCPSLELSFSFYLFAFHLVSGKCLEALLWSQASDVLF